MKSLGLSLLTVRKSRNNSLFRPAFTIVELLVVIVVIGIITAISIVSYTGIQQRAITASIQTDLSNASRQLKMYQVENSGYPNSISDCSGSTSGNMCLKPSRGNVFSGYSVNNSANPQIFTITATNGSIIYKVTNDSNPTALVSAPRSPVADWIATTRGDHYGGFYDLVSKQYATVTRATSKTIYDLSTNHIYDVPANYLGVNPRNDNKSGSEAIIEESRTNYATRSYFNSDSNSDGLTDNWSEYKTTSGAATYSRPADAVYGNNSQRAQYNSVSDSSKAWQIATGSLTGAFAAGENATASIYLKGSAVGCQVKLYVQANDSNGSYMTINGTNVTLTSSWQRFTYAYSNLPAGTSQVLIVPYVASIDAGDSFDIYMSAAQLEKGTFATSYIPTTTTSVTRNADLVTVPTSNWNMNAGTFAAVVGQSTAGATLPRIFDWTASGVNQAYWVRGIPGGASIAIVTTNSVQYQTSVTSGSGYDTLAYNFATGSNLAQYLNGAGKTLSPTAQASALSSLPSVAYLGNGGGGNRPLSGPLSRFIVYSSALSDSDITTVTSAVKDGLY